MPLPLTAQPAAASPHPLDGSDRPVIEALLAAASPTDEDIVHAARLLTRYSGSLLSRDLADKILQAPENWGLTLPELQQRARLIWQSGWRPAVPNSPQQQQVGSGADVEE